MNPGDPVDIEAIRRTLATFCLLVDEYDMQRLGEVFAADAHVDYGPGRGGPRSGRVAVVERIAAGQAEFRRTHHQLGQSIVDVAGDHASAVTYVTAWHQDWSGHVSEVRLRYLDDLRREYGTWVIARREVNAAGIVGFSGTDWDWVPRRMPAGRAG